MTHAKNDWLFFIDSDSVFCGNIEELEKCVIQPSWFDFYNLYGDLEHQQIIHTKESKKYDEEPTHADICQLSVNIKEQPDFKWSTMGKYATNNCKKELYRRTKLLLWHLNGVKPDYRLMARESTWWEKERTEYNNSSRELVDILNASTLHRIGKTHKWYPECLKTDNRFKILKDYTGKVTGRLDRFPQVIHNQSKV